MSWSHFPLSSCSLYFVNFRVYFYIRHNHNNGKISRCRGAFGLDFLPATNRHFYLRLCQYFRTQGLTCPLSWPRSSHLPAPSRRVNTFLQYTTALLKENNATTQNTLVTLVVNTAIIGNYTQSNVGFILPGILAEGTYNGTTVNLLPYFDGALLSTNMGGKSGVSQSFLDGGGAAPLMMGLPANDTTSNQ